VTTLELPESSEIKSVQIIDALGKGIEIELLNNSHSVQLDFSNLNNGVYIVEVQISTEQVVRKKVIKS